MLLLGLPCVFTMKTIMRLWLVETPPMAIEFAQIAVLSQIVGSIASSLYIPFVASGRLKLLSIIYLPLDLLFFFALFFIFKLGGSPLWSQWLYLIMAFVSVIIVRPIMLKRELNYKLSDLLPIYSTCLKVLVTSAGLSFLMSYFMTDKFVHQLLLFLSTAIIVLLCSYFFMDKSMKDLITNLVKSRFEKFQ